jgi:hypothetical protein
MACAILTDGMLKAALRRQLSADERAVLLRHLSEPCEGCLDLLEGWSTEEILASLLAPDDLLSRQEQEHLLAAGAPAEPRPSATARPPALRLVHVKAWRLPRFAWGAAAAALVLVGLVTMQFFSVRSLPRVVLGGGPKGVTKEFEAELLKEIEKRLKAEQRDERPHPSLGTSDGLSLKGVAQDRVQRPSSAFGLIPLVGVRTPTPHVVRALAPGDRFKSGEMLLLRIRLDTPAWVYLLSQKEGEPTELLWVQPAVRREAGEFEVAEPDAALVVDPSALGTGGEVLLIASPSPIDRRRLQIRERLLTREQLKKAFPGCEVDLLPILVEEHWQPAPTNR